MKKTHSLFVLLFALVLGLGNTLSVIAQDDSSLLPYPNSVVSFEEEREAPNAPGESSFVLPDYRNEREYAAVTVIDATTDFEDYRAGKEPEDGFRYVGVQMTYENLLDEEATFATTDFVIFPETGQLYRTSNMASSVPRDIPVISSVLLPGGESISGWLIYVVPEADEVVGFYCVCNGNFLQLRPLSDTAPLPGPGEKYIVRDLHGNEDGTISVTVNEVIYDHEEHVNDPHYAAPPGTQYVAIELTIENHSETDEIFYFKNSIFLLVSDEGRLVSSTTFPNGVYEDFGNRVELNILGIEEIPAGESITGYMIYPVPDGTNLATYYVHGMGSAAIVHEFEA